MEEHIKKKELLTLLDHELLTLKKNMKVYKKQGNSDLFFIANKSKVHSEVKLQLNQLNQELNDENKK